MQKNIDLKGTQISQIPKSIKVKTFSSQTKNTRNPKISRVIKNTYLFFVRLREFPRKIGIVIRRINMLQHVKNSNSWAQQKKKS